jgi:hypothetical protein
MTPDLLSVIVLLEPAAHPGVLEEVLLSLAVQDFAKLQIIVVCDEKQISGVQVTADNQRFPQSMQFEAILLPQQSKDNNAVRLNCALESCRGQFVSVLKTNDIVYGFAFERLINVLKENAEPVAVGGTRNTYQEKDGYIVNKVNHLRPGKRTCDIWFDEDCACHFVINRSKIKGNLATQPVLDYFETYFLLLGLSLHNEFNFSLAGDSLFERRTLVNREDTPDKTEKMRLRARSKVIDWQSAQLSEFKQKSQQSCS